MTPDHESLLPGIPAVLRAWGLEHVERLAAVPGGTLNWNFDVQASGHRYFLRCYRGNLETERIAGEHLLVNWIAERGIPAPVPIQTTQGETLLVNGEQRWALFPWMSGAVVERGRLSQSQARALGQMHGRVQAALASHPLIGGVRFAQRWDEEQSLALLSRLVTASKERQVESWITDGIDHQRQLLETMEVLPPEHFSSLPCQLLHGDFHDQQVLFEGDRVSAVVDWEIWHTDPRAWELVRSLSFSRLLDSLLLEDYLTGYREHVQLAEDEVQLALTLWFQSRVVGLWAWWAYLMEGNDRVAEFFAATLAEIDRVTDENWTNAIRERIVRAVCS